MEENATEAQWYWASAIFKGVHTPDDGLPCLKEQKVFLLKALSEEEAFSVAVTIAQEKQHSYQAANSSTVTWIFERIESVQLILDNVLVQGTEVFWQYFE